MNEADRALLAAAKPDFFIVEDADERAEAMRALVYWVGRRPEWGEKARAVLEDSAEDDGERCQKYAAEALSVLNRSGCMHRAWQALLSKVAFYTK